MNRYEAVFIINPVLSEEKAKEAVKIYVDDITKSGGRVLYNEFWGLRKLAYQIQKKSTGFYNLIDFESEGEFIQGLEVALKRDERIMRFLTVKMDKHHIAFADKTRKPAEKVTH